MSIPRTDNKKQREGAASRIVLGVLLVLSACIMAIPVSLSFARKNAVVEVEATGVGMSDAENVESEIVKGEGTVSEGVPEPAIFSAPQPLYYSSYQVVKGDTIGELAENYGLNQDTLLSFNKIKNSRLLQIGQYLKIPNQDGILYTARKGDSIDSLAQKYEIDPTAIRLVNKLQGDNVEIGSTIFLPEARLARIDLQEINGDLFIWPVRGVIPTDGGYGYRMSPFTGARQFHSGLDIASPYGTPIKAAMAGRVSATGYDVNSGNYVVVTHHSGYRTLYCHMSLIRVSVGEYVKTGQRIGDVGSTGLSTGCHVHFSVYKNGVTVNPRNLMN